MPISWLRELLLFTSITVVGPSGCGKTTMLRCIDGLIPLTSGSVRIGGTEVCEPDPRLAMVFQHFGLFPWQTIEKNVALGLRNQGMKKAEWQPIARHHLEQVGLAGFETAYPYQLSGGMQQRVGLARALATQPQVLLMDEPFASVDAQTRELLQEQLLELWSRDDPRTMLFVTHSIDEAIALGDRVVVLQSHPGRVREIVDMPFGWPRSLDSVQADPRLPELRHRIRDLMRAEGDEVKSPPASPRADLAADLSADMAAPRATDVDADVDVPQNTDSHLSPATQARAGS